MLVVLLSDDADNAEWARTLFSAIIAGLVAGNVIAHMLHEMKLPIPIVFVDTGVLFQETLETRDRLIRDYGYNESSATDILNFVASIFARGDAKD